MIRSLMLIPVALVMLASFSSLPTPEKKAAGRKADKKDNADIGAWGSDHVGKKLPEFLSGDECLFCHRKKIGPSWGSNRHQLSLRDFDPESPAGKQLQKQDSKVAQQIEFVLGKDHQRFLRRAKRYGRLELLSTSWHAGDDASKSLRHAAEPSWDKDRFADRCAGCHASGVHSTSKTFIALSHDCFTCHGDVKLSHSKDASKVALAPKSKTSPRVVISVCGQCHLRGGKSKSTGRSYPNQFVAGDNLFRDFRVDFSKKRLQSMNPIDQHIALNAREVAHGRSKTTCLSCHNVHQDSADKHQNVAVSNVCWSCHHRNLPRSEIKRAAVRSKVCEY